MMTKPKYKTDLINGSPREGQHQLSQSIFRKYYVYNYFKNDQNQINIAVTDNPVILEKYAYSYVDDIN